LEDQLISVEPIRSSKLTTRVLIVGSGSIGLRHLQIVRELIPSSIIKFLRHKATSTDVPLSDGYFTTLEDALNFEPTIAVIANPAPFHLGIAKALYGIGTHVLVEKPLAESNNGVSELVDLVKSRENVMQVGYNLRYSPSLIKFRELLGENVIGKVLSVRCETGQFLPAWRPNSNYHETVSAKLQLGGGVLLELSHEIDYLLWIFGQIDWVRATLSKQSDLEIDVEDTAHLVVGFSNNSYGKQVIGSVNLDFIRQDSKRECTALGEDASLRWNGLSGTVELIRPGNPVPEILFSHVPKQNETYIAEWSDFLDCVANGKPSRVTVQEAMNVLDVIEATRKSAITGIQVGVEKTIEKVKTTK
jgi:predicted dehydrogenase